jgi:dihydropteroate synthase
LIRRFEPPGQTYEVAKNMTINCKGKILSLDEPIVMGIINATPDSFYKGDLNEGIDGMVSIAKKMIDEGASILDIGGQSTKPNSKRISAGEESDRVLPAIEAIHKALPDSILSIDTYYSSVARSAVEAGACIVNDISGGNMDVEMIPAAASLNVPYICMHMKGQPENMQADPHYDDVVKEVLDFFIERISVCQSAGIKDIIIDPGFGFGKNTDHNFRLLKDLQILSITGKPILVGVSRKGMIWKTLGTSSKEALNGTTVLNTIALMNGAKILRVHDVNEAVETIKLWRRVNS